ncbi:MAG: hypothetical protein ABR970_03300 [Roseiarcus sp.]|jgi:hypothetical protein
MERSFADDDRRRARLSLRRSRRGAQAAAFQVFAGDRRLLVLAALGAVWSALAIIVHLL